MKNKLKELWFRIQLAWLLIKADRHLLITDTTFGTNTKNVDLTNASYECIENADGGFDICYMVPWSMGQKCFTFTVARFKGANAGQMCDVAVNLLNDHKVSGIMLGDTPEQPYPTSYVPYIYKKEEKDEEVHS